MMGSRRAVLYLVLVFLLGFALGGLATFWGTKAGWLPYPSVDREKSPLEWLTRELNLTPEQQQQLEPILDKTGAKYYTIFKDVWPEYTRVREESREKIRALLTEKQLVKFEELVRQTEEKEAEYHKKYEKRENSQTPGDQEK